MESKRSQEGGFGSLGIGVQNITDDRNKLTFIAKYSDNFHMVLREEPRALVLDIPPQTMNGISKK